MSSRHSAYGSKKYITENTHLRLEKLEAYLVVALMVGDSLSILPVEVEAMLYQELHRLWFYNILLHAQ